MSLHPVVCTQKCHCSQNALLGSQLHCPYIENVLISSVLTSRDDCIGPTCRPRPEYAEADAEFWDPESQQGCVGQMPPVPVSVTVMCGLRTHAFICMHTKCAKTCVKNLMRRSLACANVIHACTDIPSVPAFIDLFNGSCACNDVSMQLARGAHRHAQMSHLNLT